MSNPESTDNTKVKRMLMKLQQRSWEMELLFSGFAIYGLVELRSGIQRLALNSDIFLADDGFSLDIFLSGIFPFLSYCVLLFIIILFAHIFIRGFWIALIGLRQASGELDPTFYKIRNFFRRGKIYEEISFDKYINSTEKLASTIFGFAFLSFFVLTAISLFVIWSTVLIYSVMRIVFSPIQNGYFGLLFFIKTVSLSFLVFHFLAANITYLDFILSGRLRKVKKRIFHILIHFSIGYIGIITLSFLWRPFLINFWNSKLTSRFFYMFLVFFTLAANYDMFSYSLNEYHPVVMSADDSFNANDFNAAGIQSRNVYMSEFYCDEIESNELAPSSFITIPSKKISGRVFEVFLQNALYENTLRNWIDSLAPIKEKGIVLFGNEYPYNKSKPEGILKIKNVLQSLLEFSIDDYCPNSEQVSIGFYTHPGIHREGLLCYFPIPDNLSVGQHNLKVSFQRVDEDGKTASVDYEFPFVYEGLK